MALIVTTKTHISASCVIVFSLCFTVVLSALVLRCAQCRYAECCGADFSHTFFSQKDFAKNK